MLKVFLVEDELTIRETLRDTVPWNSCGYIFAGEASDGEVALPLIAKTKPDVLITDIKMPFMDGLSLASMVRAEFPDIKIVIISGYDDFEYAQKAIELGVSEYLLKPVTKSNLVKVLDGLRIKIEEEKAKDEGSAKYTVDSQEYELFAHHKFIERIIEGKSSIQKIYEDAAKLEIDIRASSYSLAMFTIPSNETTDEDEELREKILSYILKYPEYILIRWNITSYLVLIKGEPEKVNQSIKSLVAELRDTCTNEASSDDWYIAVGTPVERLSALPDCYKEISTYWALRYINSDCHVLNQSTAGELLNTGAVTDLSQVDLSRLRPEILLTFMRSASLEEVPSFVNEFLLSLGGATSSQSFCHYLMLNCRFTAVDYVTSLGVDHKAFLKEISCLDLTESTVTTQSLKRYLTEFLLQTVKIRTNKSVNQYMDILGRATAYIDNHYTDEDLSLNVVAGAVEVSSNYLSAMFSQEMKVTFVEYVTNKRMNRAKQLLRTTELKSGEIAAEVGYKDPHYFSSLFKKTQGMTPRDYRIQGKS
ncbi:MAG: response regulator [Saccharofermentans sp.]|nr:response regulator [Saccharofermentans sp.]